MKEILKHILLISLFFSASILSAQSYTIPGVVHVGDTATFILPLPGAELEETITLFSDSLPYHPDIDFRRVILERRRSGSTLFIEFTAFRTGRLYFPSVKAGDEIFTGLYVNIQSVIPAGAGYELGAPASSIAIPGTALMVYGSLIAIVLIILAVIWILFIGKKHISRLMLRLKRRRLLSLIKADIKHMRKYLKRGGNERELLDILCGELRSFLSSFSERNCRAMTAEEMDKINLFQQCEAFEYERLADFPGGFFRKCDRYRFSGGAVLADDALSLLDESLAHIENAAETEKAAWEAMRKSAHEAANTHNVSKTNAVASAHNGNDPYANGRTA
jgi:hypothetical protein